MFTAHTLENSTDICGVQDKCVDYVKLTYPNVTDEVWLCGVDAVINQTVIVDGHSAINVEFYANRLEENKGFNLAITCYEPGSEPSSRKRQAEEEGAMGSGRECVEVSDQKSAPVDSVTVLVSSSSLYLSRHAVHCSVGVAHSGSLKDRIRQVPKVADNLRDMRIMASDIAITA